MRRLSLADAKVLIVDDDIRNIYSLTSVLESYGMQVLHAEARPRRHRPAGAHPDIDVALIDIMMPEMDGYETMQQIRARSSIAGVPLIAVTAKAMKGDRQKCLDAGASDYIAKPVDIELLLALLRVWVANSPQSHRRSRDLDRGPRNAVNRPAVPRMASHRRRLRQSSGRASWSSTTTSATCSPSGPCWTTSATWCSPGPARMRCANC